jgi:hypothetical protein
MTKQKCISSYYSNPCFVKENQYDKNIYKGSHFQKGAKFQRKKAIGSLVHQYLKYTKPKLLAASDPWEVKIALVLSYKQ